MRRVSAAGSTACATTSLSQRRNPFQRQVILDHRQFLAEADKVFIARGQGVAQHRRQLRHRIARPHRVVRDQGPHAVQGVEEEMRIELRLEQLQFGRLQGFAESCAWRSRAWWRWRCITMLK